LPAGEPIGELDAESRRVVIAIMRRWTDAATFAEMVDIAVEEMVFTNHVDGLCFGVRLHLASLAHTAIRELADARGQTPAEALDRILAAQ
jgi:hypothetical protein